MDQRLHDLEQWLSETCNLPTHKLHAMAGDASFRRYFRVEMEDQSYVAMDAPPPRENCIPYIAIAKTLRQMGLCAPDIIASHVNKGFLLITDFGDYLYLKELNPTNAEELYTRALDALTILQSCRQVDGWPIPTFTAEFMRQELEMFKEWFLCKHMNLTLSLQRDHQLATCFDFLAQSASSQAQVFMHRDYHSANLMVLPNKQVGILDFQDAFIGPVTYDLVSLLRDCYITWPDEVVTKLVLQYWQNLNLPHVTADQFLFWFDMMGLQRHLKALLTFSRKLHRDGNASYLQHIPRTVSYIEKVSARYSNCQVLSELCIEVNNSLHVNRT